MGTNYYLRENFCTVCMRFDQRHIGKSSAGWKFLFHVTDKIDVDEWKAKTLQYRNWSDEEGIFDEYGKQVSYDDLWKLVEDKQSEKAHFEVAEGHHHKGAWLDENGYNVTKHEFS